MTFLLIAFLALLMSLLVLYRPLLGLLLAIIVGQVEFLLREDFAGTWSLGRTAGVLVLCAWVIHSVFRQRTRFMVHHRMNFVALAFLVSLGVGSIFAVSTADALYSLIRLVLLVALLIFTQDLVTSRSDLKALSFTIAVAYGLSSITGILQMDQLYAGYDVDDIMGYTTGQQELRLAGFTTNPNEYATILMSGLPFLVMWLRTSRSWLVRLLCLALLAMSSYSLVLTAARTHVAAAAAFFVFYFACRLWYRVLEKRDVILVTAVGVLVITLLTITPEASTSRLMRTEDESAMTRMELMNKGFKLAADYPVFGVGIGNSQSHPPLLGMGVHDTFSFLTGETGLVGVILVALLCLMTFAAQVRMRRELLQANDRWLMEMGVTVQAAFLAILVATFGNIILYQRMFWIYIGLSVVLANGAAYGLWRSKPTEEPVDEPQVPESRELAPVR